MNVMEKNLNRRDFLAALGVLGMAALLPACSRTNTPLRIAGNVWPGYEFLYLAQRQGWLPETEVGFVKTESATKSMQALAQGLADGATLTLDEMLRVRDQGIAMTAVLVFDISMGADALLVKPGITSLAALKGKRIALEQSALGSLMRHKALDAAHLMPADIVVVTASIDQHLKLWQSGKVDALITYEPTSTQLQSEGAKKLFDSSQIPETIFDVLAIKTDALKQHDDKLMHLVESHFRALNYFRDNPYDAAYHMAERLSLTPKQIIGAYKGLELPDEARNRKLLAGNDGPIGRAATDLCALMQRDGILKTRDDLANLVNPAFIPRIAA
jgi:NitT/TauT family transport system substrate-binding protein